MRLRKTWLVYAGVAGVIGYFIFSGDKSPTQDAQVSDASSANSKLAHIESAQPQAWQAPPPYQAPPASSLDYGYPSYPGTGYMPGLDSASRHRFRPLDPALERQGQYQPSYTYPGGSGLSSSLPSPQPIEPRGQYSPSQPGMSYRFRPLDPDRQSRRWTGNYARPGNPGNYAAPQRLPRAPVGNDSLWANSMPEY